MAAPDALRYAKIPFTHGSGAIPALGFGTLIPDPLATKQATKTALEVGFRHFDCAERYRNEQAVGEAMQEVFKAGTIQRKDAFETDESGPGNWRRLRSCISAPWDAIARRPSWTKISPRCEGVDRGSERLSSAVPSRQPPRAAAGSRPSRSAPSRGARRAAHGRGRSAPARAARGEPS